MSLLPLFFSPYYSWLRFAIDAYQRLIFSDVIADASSMLRFHIFLSLLLSSFAFWLLSIVSLLSAFFSLSSCFCFRPVSLFATLLLIISFLRYLLILMVDICCLRFHFSSLPLSYAIIAAIDFRSFHVFVTTDAITTRGHFEVSYCSSLLRWLITPFHAFRRYFLRLFRFVHCHLCPLAQLDYSLLFFFFFMLHAYFSYAIAIFIISCIIISSLRRFYCRWLLILFFFHYVSLVLSIASIFSLRFSYFRWCLIFALFSPLLRWYFAACFACFDAITPFSYVMPLYTTTYATTLPSRYFALSLDAIDISAMAMMPFSLMVTALLTYCSITRCRYFPLIFSIFFCAIITLSFCFSPYFSRHDMFTLFTTFYDIISSLCCFCCRFFFFFFVLQTFCWRARALFIEPLRMRYAMVHRRRRCSTILRHCYVDAILYAMLFMILMRCCLLLMLLFDDAAHHYRRELLLTLYWCARCCLATLPPLLLILTHMLLRYSSFAYYAIFFCYMFFDAAR